MLRRSMHVRSVLSRVWRQSSRGFGAIAQGKVASSSQELIDLEYEYSAHNYHPIPVVFSEAKGHCHPRIIKVLQEQAAKLTLSSKAFYNDKFPVFAELLTSMFGYEMVLPMNTGAEGVETALKLAMKWGYEKKHIPKDQAVIISCRGCFHGRTLAVISMSCDNEATNGFGPLFPSHLKVDFGDAAALEKIFKEKGDQIAGFLFEPIQGEAGVIIPPDGYLKAVRDLCTKHNVLMIADEIQSGLAQSSKLLVIGKKSFRML